jgi:hypothetical protein
LKSCHAGVFRAQCRFALPRPQITEALVNALALRRIRDTAAAR